MKAIIIEDEKPARELIQFYAKDIPGLDIIGEYDNGFSGLKGINELKPDLVFLDIQLPKINGFELLEILDEQPHIIFTTAFDEYAIQAFEKNAVDYLLKPFSKERFLEAVNKTMQRMEAGSPPEVDKNLLQADTPQKEYLIRIVMKSGQKVHVIPVEEIIFIEAQDDYVMVHTLSGKHLKQATMKGYEQNLDPEKFIRIHRSFIINIDFITGINLFEKDSYRVELKNKHHLRTSKSGYKLLKTVLGI
jgi:two-component system, LytTR family, response regulator